jgi:hypothetical protein
MARGRAKNSDAPMNPIDRVSTLDWPRISDALDAHGVATTGMLLDAATCANLRELYGDPTLFRSRIVMAHHNFGRGECQYFSAPLPALVADLRAALYPPLAAIANRWAARLNDSDRYPDTHEQFLAWCHAAGQSRPTPLLLKYGAGDYNCMHQDLYGALAFPLQVVFLLSDPGTDFSGGEFLLVEQRPRMQSRGEVVQLSLGEAAIFPVNRRPVAGARGDYRVAIRHGVSRVRSGTRFTLGIIFHDAA